MTRHRSPWPLVAAIGVTVAVGIGGLVSADGRAPTNASRQDVPTPTIRYVAIGDSFTAGGDMGPQQAGSGTCLRSSVNYPSLVAEELGYALTDVSCVGATTQHVLDGSRAVPTAQVDAVDDETDLVTVSIGGNDLRLYADMLFTCLRVSRPGSDGAPCRSSAGRTMAQKLPDVKLRLGRVLDEIRERAPDAHVLVVTYLGLMPTDTTCASTPFAPRDVSWFAGVERSIATAMAAAARERKVDVVDGHALSRGHDVCRGKAAWVNGARPKTDDGLLYHPNSAGERALAKAIADRLRDVALS
jgi:lysophospholipase L1-like esterase